MFILLKNADIYEPSYTGRKDVLICNERIIKVADELHIPVYRMMFDETSTEFNLSFKRV
jgi:hypothetical protein